MSSWIDSCALSLELCAQHLFRGCQSSATSLSFTFGEWQQQINFSVRLGPQPSLCSWYQTLSPILKSAFNYIKTSSMARGTTTGRSVTTTKMDWKVGCFRCSKTLTHRGPFRCTWTTFQGQCAANLVRGNQASDPSCFCGAPLQTMSHTVKDCPDTKFPGGLSALH